MIKIVLALVLAILIILGIYTYSNQTTEKSHPTSTPTVSLKKKEVKKREEVPVVAQKIQEKKSSAKNVTVKSPKVVSKETRNKEKSSDSMFASTAEQSTVAPQKPEYSLDEVETLDISEEKRERLKTEIAIYESYVNRNEPPVITEEKEGLKLLDK